MTTAQEKWTPGPWEYVPSTEHHGPYVAGPFSGDICDCYTMSNPHALSVLNGGDSQPIHFQGDSADANARLIAAAPELYEALQIASGLIDTPIGRRKLGLDANGEAVAAIRAALSKARGEQP